MAAAAATAQCTFSLRVRRNSGEAPAKGGNRKGAAAGVKAAQRWRVQQPTTRRLRLLSCPRRERRQATAVAAKTTTVSKEAACTAETTTTTLKTKKTTTWTGKCRASTESAAASSPTTLLLAKHQNPHPHSPLASIILRRQPRYQYHQRHLRLRRRMLWNFLASQ